MTYPATVALLAIGGTLLLCLSACIYYGIVADWSAYLFHRAAMRWRDHQRTVHALHHVHGFDQSDAKRLAGKGWGRVNLWVMYAQLRVASTLHKVGEL